MQPFTVSYTKAINKQQKRIGHLFQGPFQAKLVDRNEYLLHFNTYAKSLRGIRVSDGVNRA